MVDQGPEALKITTLARHAPSHYEVSVGGLEHRWQREAASLDCESLKKKRWLPKPPNRGAETARREAAPVVQRQKAKQ